MMPSQFFLRTTDEEVERYLKIFTFIRVVELDGIMHDHKVRVFPLPLFNPSMTDSDSRRAGEPEEPHRPASPRCRSN